MKLACMVAVGLVVVSCSKGCSKESQPPYVGTWKSTCLSNGLTSYTSTFVFGAGGELTWAIELFRDKEGCKKPYSSWVNRGTYEPVSETSLRTNYSTTVTTPLSEQALKEYRANHECKIANWKMNEAVETPYSDCVYTKRNLIYTFSFEGPKGDGKMVLSGVEENPLTLFRN